MKTKNLLLALVLVLSYALAACDFNGGVEQGRCVAFDANAKTLTLVEDTALDQHNPHYSGKVFTFKLPTDPKDMGPAPEVGGLLQLEFDKNMVLYYDPATKNIKECPVEFVEREKGINGKHPKLKGKTFPIIDKEQRTITVYSPRLEELVTFKVSPEELAMPVFTWQLGDEVRVAYRNDNKEQAIRVMNVSKTSIFTR